MSNLKKLKKQAKNITIEPGKYSFNTHVEKEIFKLFYNKQSVEESEIANNKIFQEYGKALMDIGRDKEALIYLKKALEVNPVDEVVLYDLAILYLNLNNLDEAYDYINKLIKYAFHVSLLNQGYMLLQKYYELTNEDELVEILGYLVEYTTRGFYGSNDTEYNEEMFKKASENSIPIKFSEDIINHLQNAYDNSKDLSEINMFSKVIEHLKAYNEEITVE